MKSYKDISEYIKDNVDINSIIGNYVSLVKKGKDYWCVCPFHNDSNPSLSISTEKKLWKCFSCSEAGNVITFIRKIENCSFEKAINIIIEKSGLEIEGFKIDRTSNENEVYYDINSFANNIFKLTLQSSLGKNAIKYLHDRDITDKLIDKFEIGFSSSKTNLGEKLLSKGYNLTDIEKSCLSWINENKNFDYFVDRIIFPIRDIENNLVGFSGRVIDKKSEPKYLNSKENLVFKKSNIIYNINNIKSSDKNLIILEGFMDVISLSKININNAVALMGTNISYEQIKYLKKINKKIILFLDGDLPGVKATLKISEELLKNNIDVQIIDNNTENDPDELIKKDINVFNELINNPINVVYYYINKTYQKININDTYELKKWFIDIKKYISLSKLDFFITDIVNHINKLTDISKESIEQSLTSINQQHMSNSDAQFNQESLSKNTYSNKSNKELFNTKNEKLFDWVIYCIIKINSENIIELTHYISNKVKFKLAKKIIDLYNTNKYEGNDISKLIKILNNNDEYVEILNLIKKNNYIPIKDFDKLVEDIKHHLVNFPYYEKVLKDYDNLYNNYLTNDNFESKKIDVIKGIVAFKKNNSINKKAKKTRRK